VVRGRARPSAARGFGPAGRPAGRPASQSSSSSQRYVTGALHLRGPNGKNSASLSLAAGHHRRPAASQPGRAGCKKTGQGAAALHGISITVCPGTV